MIIEALQAPKVVAQQFLQNQTIWQDLWRRINQTTVPLMMTVARGSSDHAATFAKYLFETQLGIVTASSAPSIVTIYQSRQQLKNCLVIALSQSGQSPDICEVLSMAREQGAITVALVNKLDSQLASIAEYVLPLWAGEESAVAATKSYIAMLAALLQGVALGTNNTALLKSLETLPELLHQAAQANWSIGSEFLTHQQNLLILGRGYGFPIALEAALKCKETAALHAEAFSTAEVQHGPLALVQHRFPILIFCQDDPTFATNMFLAHKLRDLGSEILSALPQNLHDAEFDKIATILPLPASAHGLLDPVIAIQAFYPMVAELAQLRGYNPDQPANLQKVTRTR